MKNKLIQKSAVRLLGLFLAAAAAVWVLPPEARAAVPSGGLSGGYFLSGTPPFAYVVTSTESASKNTVKLYQNEIMQSYADYTGTYVIPDRVFNSDELRTYTVSEIGGAVGTVPGALENVPLKGITLPKALTVIGSRAFAGCTNLEEITFPTSVTQLASDAFSGVSLSKLTLDVTAEASLAYPGSYTPNSRAVPISLPTAATDLLVEAPLTITGYMTIPGDTTLSGGRITVQPGASLTLDGALSGTGVIEVMNGGSLTLASSSSFASYTGTIRLSGAASQITNGTSVPVTVTDASGRTVVVQGGDTRTGGQKDETPENGSDTALRPQITATYGGTVTVQDSGKTVVITPFQGYRVEEVVINGLSMGSITRYEFQAASSQNTVAVTFSQGEDPEGPDAPNIDPVFLFNDVSPSAPYAQSVAFLVNNGIFQGVGKNTFAPNQNTTKAMMASLFQRLEVYGEDFQLVCQNPVYADDTPEGAWYTESAAWAVGTGVIPQELGGFFPDRLITREDLALCLYRYTHLRGYDTALDYARMYAYKDIGSLSSLSRRAMAWAATNGYITANGGSVNPQAPVTRAEMAQTLARYLQAN